MKMRKLVILSVFFALCLSGMAQRTDKGNFVTKVNAIPGGYNFWVYTPVEYEVDRHPLPLSFCMEQAFAATTYSVFVAMGFSMR